VGLSGLEPLTSPLSGARSSQLSYRPEGESNRRQTVRSVRGKSPVPAPAEARAGSVVVRADPEPWNGPFGRVNSGHKVLRKEVIQPQVLLRLPCYDLVPVAGFTVGAALPPKQVRPTTSRAPSSRGLTGGVYNARARIHRGVADPRLLAIPRSRGRISAPDPNWDRLLELRSTLQFRFPLCRPL
jgi:hypothetical protein